MRLVLALASMVLFGGAGFRLRSRLGRSSIAHLLRWLLCSRQAPLDLQPRVITSRWLAARDMDGLHWEGCT